MRISLNFLDITVIVAYLLALLIIGFGFGSKRSKKDIFLAGRSFKWPFIGFSLFATNVSPMMMIGFAGLAYSHGMAGANFEWLAWVFLMLLAMVFIPVYARTKISTMPQFLKVRYGNKAYRFLSVYSLFSILLVWVSSALYAGGLLISQLFGFSLWMSMLGIALIGSSFAAFGGLSAIVRTDVLQSAIIILSSALLVFWGIEKIGGISALVHKVPGDYWKLFKSSGDQEYSWYAILLGYPVAGIYYWCTDQTIVQKVLAAKNREQGQYGVILLSFLKLLTPFIFILPGILCLALYPHLGKPDSVYTHLIITLMPSGILGLSVAGLLAALINTVATGLNSFSTVFTLDFYTRWKSLTEKQVQYAGRLVTLAGTALAFLIALIFSFSGKIFFDITQGMVSILAPPLSVVFLVGAFWKKATDRAAEWTLYGGGALCIIVGICYILNFPYKGYWPNFLMLSFYLFLFLLIVMILVSSLTKVTEGSPLLWKEAKKENHFNRVWIWWAVVAIAMVSIYLIFN
ncbi:MAG TPA: sodium/solute symporter [Chitinophagaceae bacterium]